jgi:hypothetical protein
MSSEKVDQEREVERVVSFVARKESGSRICTSRKIRMNWRG